jgi:O-antigen/teichoic acid export membrane protein
VSAVRPDAEADDVLAGTDVGGRVVRGGAVRGLGYVAGNVFSAAASVLLLRYLGPGEFGRYVTVTAVVAIVGGITDAGLTATGARELSVLPKGPARRRLTADVAGIRIVLTAIGVAVGTAFSLVAGYGSALVVGTVLMGAGLLLTNAQSAMLLPLSVELRNERVTANEVARQVLTVAGIAVLVVAGTGLVPFFAVQIAVGAVVLLASPLLLGRGGFIVPQFHWARWKPVIRETLPLAVAVVLSVLYFRVLVVMMSLLTDDVQTGIFGTAYRIFEILVGLPILLNTVVLPVVSAAPAADRARYVLQRMVEVGATIGAGIAVVVAVAAVPIVLALGGPEYREAARPLAILSFALVFVFLNQAFNVSLIARRRQRRIAVAGVIGLAVVVVGGLVLIPPLDAEGAAIAALLGEIALCVATYTGLRGTLEGDLDARFALRLLAALVPAAACLAPVGPALVRAPLAALLFAVAVWRLGLIPGEVSDQVAALVRRRRGDDA